MANSIKELLNEELRALTALDGAPGFEQPVVSYLRDAFTPIADSVEVDSMGNLYALRKGHNASPRLALFAHSDEIGALVKSIEPEGFLRIERLGGTLPALMVGRHVRVNGHFGIIGVRSGHLQLAGNESNTPVVSDLYVDLGAKNAQEVEKMGIQIGDPINYHSPLTPLTNPDLVTGKAIDNRLGCAILLQLLRELQGITPAADLMIVIAVQEEVGSRGARVAARHAKPDYAIVVDTFMAGDTPDVNFYAQMPAGIGRGPIFLLACGDKTLGHLIHPAVKRSMIDTAQRRDIPYQPATMVEISFTDSTVIHLTRDGVPTGGLGLSRRYSHSPVELADLNDAVHALRFLQGFVEDMPQHGDFSFL